MGLTSLTLWLTCALAVRNQRILAAWDARQEDNARRATAGLPLRTANGGGPPSPARSPALEQPGTQHHHGPRPGHHRQQQTPISHAQHHANQPQPAVPHPASTRPPRLNQARRARRRPRWNVRPKCEHGAWRDVKISGCAARDLNPGPAD
jgi:hypothetical protein